LPFKLAELRCVSAVTVCDGADFGFGFCAFARTFPKKMIAAMMASDVFVTARLSVMRKSKLKVSTAFRGLRISGQMRAYQKYLARGVSSESSPQSSSIV